MKMLTKDSSIPYLESLKARLEEQGIPAVIQGRETARMFTSRILFEPSLWIYLDGQFDDAAKLIDGDEHQVTTGIDIDNFYASQSDPKALDSAVNQVLLYMTLYLAVFIVSVFVITRAF